MNANFSFPRLAGRALTGLLIALLAISIHAQEPQAFGPAADDAAPEAVVDSLEQLLLDNMQSPSLDHTARSQRLQAVVERAFNFSRMGRFLFGSRWNDFSDSERQQFSELFQALTVSTYAARFREFDNQKFEPVNASQPDERRAQVQHELVTAKGERIRFDYLLLKEDDQWRIVNITTRGVSDLALKRSQYSKLFGEGGLQAVLDYITEQTQREAES